MHFGVVRTEYCSADHAEVVDAGGSIYLGLQPAREQNVKLSDGARHISDTGQQSLSLKLVVTTLGQIHR